jgi:hypothetical protein
LRFLLSDLAKGFADVVAKEIQRPFAKASTAAVREPGDSGFTAPTAASTGGNLALCRRFS